MLISVFNIGHASSTATVASFSLTTGVAVPAGATVFVGVRENGASAIGSFSDSKGNTYTLIASVFASGGTAAPVALFYSVLTTALTSSDTITYTKHASADVTAFAAGYATGLSSAPLDSAANATNSGASGTAMSVTSGTPSQAGDLFVGVACGNATTGTPTLGGSGWTQPPFDIVNLSNGIQLVGAYKFNPTASTQAFAATQGASANWGAVVTAFKAMPFSQTEWPRVRPVQVATAMAAIPVSLALLTPTQNPFSLTDWSVPARVKSAPQQGYPPYNPNLFTNPIPFGPYDYNKAVTVRSAPPQPQPYNIKIYSEVPPPNYDLSARPNQFPPRAPDQIYPDLVLLTAPVAMPFAQYDWSKPFFPPPSKDTTQPTNINLFTNPIPFGPYDYNKTVTVRSSPPQPQPYNIQIYSEVPPPNFDWSARPNQFPPRAPDQIYPNFALYVTPPPPQPFAQYDWSKPFFPRTLKDNAPQTNINLFPNPIPFGPYDWTATPRFVPRSPPQPVERNPLIYSGVPRTFFDWSKGIGVRSTPVQPQPYNVLLYAQPFLTFDFGTPRRVPSVPPAVPIYNLNLLAPPVVTRPFIPFDWSKPYALRPSVPQGPLNLTLFLPPPVIVGVPGLAFSKDIPVALFRAYDAAAVAAKAADLAIWKSKAADIAAAEATAKDVASFTVKASDSPSGQNWSGAGYMAQYEIDTTIELQGIFVNALSGVYADPTTITLYIEDPTGAITTQAWPGPNIVRDSLGHFHYILTPALPGNWTYKWRGFGTVQATSPDTVFTVNQSAFLP